jgi:hypothetical protein
MNAGLVGQRLVLVFVLGLVLLNDPVLSLFDHKRNLAGIPLLFLYLFFAWALLIGLMAWVVAGEEE